MFINLFILVIMEQLVTKSIPPPGQFSTILYVYKIGDLLRMGRSVNCLSLYAGSHLTTTTIERERFT